MAIIVSPTMPPGPHAFGDEWHHTISGLKFRWTQNSVGGGVWVQFIPAGEAPIPFDAPVITNPTPRSTQSSYAPAVADPGDFWYHTETGVEFVYYDDGNTRQWVTTQPTKAGDIIVVTGPAGGDLVGSYPNPHIRPDVELTGVPTLETPPAPGATGNEIVTADWVNDVVVAAMLDVEWDEINNKPATFPPTLPIAQSGVTNLITDLANKQPLDPTLTALAALDPSTGLLEQTGADTFVKRAMGTGGATSILTRADGDARYVNIDGDLMTGKLTITVADDAQALLLRGASKGVRFVPRATSFDIEGVDNTGSTSYQPLRLYGTTLTLDAPTTVNGALAGTSTIASGVGGVGKAILNPGAAAQSGYLALHRADNTRIGYIGFSNTAVGYVAELAGSFHNWWGPASAQWMALNGSATSASLTIGGVTNHILLQHDGTHAYIRPQNAASFLFLGGAGANSVLVSSGGLFPVPTVTQSSGNASNTWLDIWSANFTLNHAAGNVRAMRMATAGTMRWSLGIDGSAESGSNAGSTLFINRYNDTGVYIDTPFQINRATGTISTPTQLTLSRAWNAAGTNFETIFANITDTAEAGSSRLIHFQRNGSDVFAIDKYGTLITGGGIYNGDVVQSWGAHKANVNSAPPAGGDLNMGQFFSNVANFGVLFGTGAPNKAAAAGSIYLRRDGPPQYNTDGTAGGWSAMGGGAAVHVGTAAPASPSAGQLWWQTDLGQMFIYYNDGSTTQWVPASPAVGTELAETFQVVAASGSLSMNNNFTSIFRTEVPPSTVLDVGGNIQTNLGGTNVLGFSAVRAGKWMFTAEAFFNGADGMHVVALWHQTSAGATIQIYEQGNVNSATGIGTVTSAIINVAAGDRVFPFWATSGTNTVIAGAAGAVGGFGAGAKLCKFLGQRLAS